MNLVIVESPTKVPKNTKSLISLFFEDPRFYNPAKGENKIGTKTILSLCN